MERERLQMEAGAEQLPQRMVDPAEVERDALTAFPPNADVSLTSGQ